MTLRQPEEKQSAVAAESLRARRPGLRTGSSLIQALVAMVVLGDMASLAVDVGVFCTAKLELQRAADAAALAAAQEVQQGGPISSSKSQAIAYAQANSIAGDTISAGSVDVSYGGYKNGSFVAGATPTEAMKVVLRRTAATGNPIALYFARFVGLYSIDAAAASVARVRPTSTYNLVGINQASFASLGVLATISGRFVSNGDVSVGTPLGLLVGVQGDARSWAGTTRKGTLAAISGSTTSLDHQLVYPSVSLPAINDNDQIGSYLSSSGDLNLVVAADLPAGTYVVRDFNILAGIAVRLEGPVTIYVTRNFNLAAAVNLLGDTNFDPSNFKVRVLPGGCVNFLAPVLVPLRMDLYAPDSDINIAVGISAFKGRIIGKTLDISLPVLSNFTEDQTLGDAISGLQQAISLAKQQ